VTEMLIAGFIYVCSKILDFGSTLETTGIIIS